MIPPVDVKTSTVMFQGDGVGAFIGLALQVSQIDFFYLGSTVNGGK